MIVHYLRLVLDPSGPAFTYDWRPEPSWRAVLPQVALLTVLGTLTMAALSRRHPAGLLGAWFFLILAPSSSVLPIATEVAAAHRMYLPLAAVVAGAVLAVRWALVRFAPAATLRYAWVPALATAAAFGWATQARNEDYWSLEALMRDAAGKRPHDVRPRVVLGGHLLGQERFSGRPLREPGPD